MQAVLDAVSPPPSSRPHGAAAARGEDWEHERHRRELAENGFTIIEAVLSRSEVARASSIFDRLLTPRSAIPVACTNPGEGGRRQLSMGCPATGGLLPALAKYGELPSVLRSAAAVMAELAMGRRVIQTPPSTFH
jgi:hypothetical protein